MAILVTQDISLRQFTWNPETRTLSAEASDLEGRIFQNLYNDACDVGFSVRSHHTGKVERFYLEDVETDHQAAELRNEAPEILAWHFKPLDRKSRVKEIVVFND